MVNDMYSALAEKLEETFDSPRIYSDSIPQCFRAPCFFINLMEASHELRLWNRYELNLDFDIIYYPEENRENNVIEFNDIASKLLYSLEYVTLDKAPLRGRNIMFRVEDDILHFLVSYQIFVRKTAEKGPLMMDLTQRYRIK